MTSPGRLIHQALVYGSPQEFLDTALPFVRDGLRHGEAVLATVADANADRLRAALGDDTGRVTFIGQSRWYLAPGRTLASYHEFIDEHRKHHDRIRFLGEPVWAGLDELETTEWGRHESVVNVALAASPAWIMCGYDRTSLPESIVRDAGRTHPELAGLSTRTCSHTFADPAEYYRECNKPLPPPPATGVERLPFDADIAAVRRFVTRYAVPLGLPLDRLDDFTLAVNEVATNAVRHGGGCGQARLWRTGHRLVCEIGDPGTVEDGFLGYHRGDADAEHGHGLWIARQLCDILEIRTHQPGTRVRLHIRCD